MDLRQVAHRNVFLLARASAAALALAVASLVSVMDSKLSGQEKARPVSVGAPNTSATGWLQFEKCPVFAIESIDLPAQDAGIIGNLDVQVNETVQANQVLGKLDARMAENEKNAASLQTQSASFEANQDSEVNLAIALGEEAKLQLELSEEMNRRGTLGDNELRQKQLAVKQAEYRVEQSKATKLQKEFKSKLAQMSLLAAQLKLDRLTLRSPVNGTVTRIEHRPGEFVQAGTTILTIVRLNELRVDCFVDIDQTAPSRLVNLPVKVIMKRGGEESAFSGKITSFDPDVSSGGMVRVHATIQNQRSGEHWQVLPGMSVTMQVPKPSK